MLKVATPSLGWTLFTGFILTSLPLAAVSAQAARLATGEALAVPVEIMQFQHDHLVPMVEIDTPIQTLDLEHMTGDNIFTVDQIAYVFMKKSGVTWYPYAILKSAPINSSAPQDTLMLRARVKSQSENTLRLSYSFDKISPQQSFMRAVMKHPAAHITLGLSVSEDGRASASALYVEDLKYDQRVTLKSVLFGRKNTKASSAPPT